MEKIYAHGALTLGAVPARLVRAKAANFPHVAMVAERTDAAVATMSEIAEANPDATFQLQNRVRKCTKCGKPNAYTLTVCNSCGATLPEEIGFTNNIFTGFIFGVKKAPFPFTISLRHQSPEAIVFDDLLALSPCHQNVIPANTYIADIRALFAAPAQGLAMISALCDRTWGVVVSQFLSNDAWRTKMLKHGGAHVRTDWLRTHPGADPLSFDWLRPHVFSGFNYPPSQYQLHIQHIMPPLTPHHYQMYLDGHHFTKHRFFPFVYVAAALQACVDAERSIEGAAAMDIEALVAEIATLGVDYNAVYDAEYARYGESHRLLANWSVDDFESIVVGDEVRDLATMASTTQSAEDAEKMKSGVYDKNALQNYGRPYDAASGRPSGTYYAHTKTCPLPVFPSAL